MTNMWWGYKIYLFLSIVLKPDRLFLSFLSCQKRKETKKRCANLGGKKAAKTASFFPPSTIDWGKVSCPLQPCSAKVLQGPHRKMGKVRCVPIGLLFLLRKNPLAAPHNHHASAVNQGFAKTLRYVLKSSIISKPIGIKNIYWQDL